MKAILPLLVILSLTLTNCTKTAIEGLSLPEKTSIDNLAISPVIVTKVSFNPDHGPRGRVSVYYSPNPDYIFPSNEPFTVEILRTGHKISTSNRSSGSWGDIHVVRGATYNYSVHLIYDSGLTSVVSNPYAITIPS